MGIDNGHPSLGPMPEGFKEKIPPQMRQGEDQPYVDQCEKKMGDERAQRLANLFGTLNEAVITLRTYQIEPMVPDHLDKILTIFDALGVEKVSRERQGEEAENGRDHDPYEIMKRLGEYYMKHPSDSMGLTDPPNVSGPDIIDTHTNG